jgi:glucose/mannose transport system substrate-binding protein
MAVPGTEDYFLNVLDTFCWPKNSPTPEASKEFCRWCASVEGQEILNSIKGSIPPRGDVPRDEFGGYQTDQMDAIEQTEAQPLTMTFTGSVPPEVSSSMKETIGTFVANTNVDSAYQGFSNAF